MSRSPSSRRHPAPGRILCATTGPLHRRPLNSPAKREPARQRGPLTRELRRTRHRPRVDRQYHRPPGSADKACAGRRPHLPRDGSRAASSQAMAGCSRTSSRARPCRQQHPWWPRCCSRRTPHTSCAIIPQWKEFLLGIATHEKSSPVGQHSVGEFLCGAAIARSGRLANRAVAAPQWAQARRWLGRT